MSIAAPTDLLEAVDILWLHGFTKDNLYTAPAFVRLRETCQRLYPSAGSREAMNFALSRAVYALGFRCSEAAPARLAMPSDAAAARIDRAFRQTQARLVHLCPLDLGDKVPNLAFGPNRIQAFTASELDNLLDPDGLTGIRNEERPANHRLREFSWLVVEENLAILGACGVRALPEFSFHAGKDFGRIEPHESNFPAAVEEALFALLTLPWEDVTMYSDLDWRPFHVPWVHTLSDDLFASQPMLPSADTLSWEPDYYYDTNGDWVEYERPTRLRLTDDAIAKTAHLDDATWAQLTEARRSPLFAGPIPHFVIRAFASKGIDEFLAHITAIEAALGTPIDHDARGRPRSVGGKNPGATARVAARLSALLGDRAAGECYKVIFKERSNFLHGRSLSDIPGRSRIAARRLARRCICALIRAATSPPRPESQELFLDGLLQRAWSGQLHIDDET